jgi:hypothetical protein
MMIISVPLGQFQPVRLIELGRFLARLRKLMKLATASKLGGVKWKSNHLQRGAGVDDEAEYFM